MTFATYSETIGDSIYVYVLGQLIMKIWLRSGRSAVFYECPAWVEWVDIVNVGVRVL